jgi:site-specific recombinase XerD
VSAERPDLPMLVEGPAPVTAAMLRSSLAVPAMIAAAGDRAARRFLEFFAASIENDNTRMAYYRAVCSFFAWLDELGLGELPDIEPFHVAAYLKALRVADVGARTIKERTASRPTVKQHLAAIRMLFDWLVVGQILAINPAHAVRGPKHVVKRGKTPVLSEDQARHLLASIKVTKRVTLPDGSEAEMPSLVGLRDRALIGVMVYSFARISAVVAMEVEDYFANGKRWWLRLHEKGGKRHEMPAHHKLEQFLDEYLDAAGIRENGKTPLFRSALGRTGILTDRPMHRIDAYQMVRRRTVEAGLKGKLGCHVFRATGITPISRPAARSKMPRRWPHTKARAPPSSTTAPATRSRSMRSSGYRFEDEAPVLAWRISGDRLLPRCKPPISLSWAATALCRQQTPAG